MHDNTVDKHKGRYFVVPGQAWCGLCKVIMVKCDLSQNNINILLFLAKPYMDECTFGVTIV